MNRGVGQVGLLARRFKAGDNLQIKITSSHLTAFSDMSRHRLGYIHSKGEQ